MRKIVLAGIVAGWLFSTVWFYHAWEWWLSYGTGSYNCTPRLCPNGVVHNYNYNSGFGSIIEPAFIQLGWITVLFWWHHQCHVDGCYRYARRLTDAGDRACWKHHPQHHKRMTVELLHLRHHAASAAATVEAVTAAPGADTQ